MINLTADLRFYEWCEIVPVGSVVFEQHAGEFFRIDTDHTPIPCDPPPTGTVTLHTDKTRL